MATVGKGRVISGRNVIFDEDSKEHKKERSLEQNEHESFPQYENEESFLEFDHENTMRNEGAGGVLDGAEAESEFINGEITLVEGAVDYCNNTPQSFQDWRIGYRLRVNGCSPLNMMKMVD
jgi:hypothetical protein